MKHGPAISIAILIYLVLAFVLAPMQPTDDSDGGRWNRSGLRLHSDALTGCEYFSTIFGSPTPRLDGEGKQICRRTTP